MHLTKTAWWRIDRARGWYKAAVMARIHRMAIMGYETAPDYYFWNGELDGGLGRTELGAEFVTAGERERFTASTAVPGLRFHYRYIAVDEAEHAADLVPPRSQAFAAILCNATNWMTYTSRDSDVTPAGVRARLLYRRYVKEGPFVPWAGQFGVCPLSKARLGRQFSDEFEESSIVPWAAGQFSVYPLSSKQLRWSYMRRLEQFPDALLGKDLGSACPEPTFDAAACLPGYFSLAIRAISSAAIAGRSLRSLSFYWSALL